jgi:hypothetical protein
MALLEKIARGWSPGNIITGCIAKITVAMMILVSFSLIVRFYN